MLAILALAPLVLTIVSALALRTRDTPEMTIGTFALLPLLAIELARIKDIDLLCRIAARLAAAVTLGALVLSPAIAAAAHLSVIRRHEESHRTRKRRPR